MFLRETVTSITAAWQINKHYWRVSASSEGRAGLQGVCQGDVVILPVLTELSFLLLDSVNRNSYWGGLKNSRLYMWKARCYKTLLVKHFLFGALAWHTVDVRHKAFLFPLHLTPSVFQRGAPWRPGLADVMGMSEPFLLLWVSSPLCKIPVLEWFRFNRRGGVFVGFVWLVFVVAAVWDFFEVVFVEKKRESRTRSFRICIVPCALWARPEADKDWWQHNRFKVWSCLVLAG